jgi:hypothetical protein
MNEADSMKDIKFSVTRIRFFESNAVLEGDVVLNGHTVMTGQVVTVKGGQNYRTVTSQHVMGLLESIDERVIAFTHDIPAVPFDIQVKGNSAQMHEELYPGDRPEIKETDTMNIIVKEPLTIIDRLKAVFK